MGNALAFPVRIIAPLVIGKTGEKSSIIGEDFSSDKTNSIDDLYQNMEDLIKLLRPIRCSKLLKSVSQGIRSEDIPA